jgi:ABC-type transport system substrate-binding protein
MEMEKKNLAIIILAVILAASGVGNILLGMQLGIIEVVAPQRSQDLVYGTFQGDIVHLDPTYAYDSASGDIIDQVVETLYRFNVSDPNVGIVPQLASGMPTYNPAGDELTVPLRQGVMFHDNTTFDAYDVKWSFDRLAWFFNYSGNAHLPAPFNVSLPTSLPSGIPTPTQLFHAVYENPDGTPIVNETVVVSQYVIKFVLNQPRAAFFPILAFSGSGILSPESTPANDYLTLIQDLVGTGPFMYDSFTAGVEIKMSAFYIEDPLPDNDVDEHIEYWGGRPELDTITVAVLSSLAVLNQALLSGDIDILTAMDPAFLDQHEADPDITLHFAGPTTTVSWVTFNVLKIPLIMRKAASYALNYSYIIDVVYDRVALRWPTYIPNGIPHANYSLNAPIFNRTYARELLLNDAVYGPICAGLGLTAASTDADWTTVADGPTPIESYNYSWNLGNDLRHDTGDRLAFDLRFIGVNMEVFGIAWGDLICAIVNRRDELDSYMLGWRPDYLDPENYISAIWHAGSAINGGNYNETDVVALMDAGMIETDLATRDHIYDEIQRLMVERDYPGIPLVSGLNYDAWKNEVVGYPSNSLGKVWWYDVHFE